MIFGWHAEEKRWWEEKGNITRSLANSPLMLTEATGRNTALPSA